MISILIILRTESSMRISNKTKFMWKLYTQQQMKWGKTNYNIKISDENKFNFFCVYYFSLFVTIIIIKVTMNIKRKMFVYEFMCIEKY